MGPKRKAVAEGEAEGDVVETKKPKALYNMPKKAAMQSGRLKLQELKGVPLGIAKRASFEDNCESLRENISISGQLEGSIAWTPAEAHFQMNQFFRNWQTGGVEEEKAVVYRLKAFIEQEWPEQFAEHKNAKK